MHRGYAHSELQQRSHDFFLATDWTEINRHSPPCGRPCKLDPAACWILASALHNRMSSGYNAGCRQCISCLFSLEQCLVIPPNQVKEFFQLWTVPFAKLTLIGIAPHAHLICTEMEAWAEKSNGERIELVHTPHWDFD